MAAAADACAAPRSLFAVALEKLPSVRDSEGNILTAPFLDCCELIIPVIESFGTAFAIVRSDIGGNVSRLRARLEAEPERAARLFAIVEEDIARGDLGGTSCTKGLLWLKRANEFMVAILRGLLDRPGASLSESVHAAYHATLHNFHGWLSSSAFKVAFAFVPSKEPFLERVAGGPWSHAAEAQMREFAAQFGGLLSEVHAFLDARGQDDPYKA